MMAVIAKRDNTVMEKTNTVNIPLRGSDTFALKVISSLVAY
jgi:hypothetical protein